jgi:GT2 family glycosyltransferase
VKASTTNLNVEVFVVDNNSSDGSLEYLCSKFPEIIFIANKDNKGFSKANNQAIRQATGKYVLLLNPDTVLGENSLDIVCKFMYDHSDAGGIGVKMIDGYGCFLPESKRGFPSPWNSFCKIAGLSKIFPYSSVFAKYHLRYLDEDEVHVVDVLAGAFVLLRRTVLDEIGLLDESFFMYGEDIDLSYRISQAGYRNYYVPEIIIHYKGESTKKDLRYVRIFYEAMLIFFKKHYPHYGWFYTWIIRFGIHFIRGISSLSKLVSNSRRKLFIKKGQINNFDERNILFNTADISYEGIISKMNISKGREKCRYWIYHPNIDVAIASNEVLTNKDKIYGLVRK